MTREFIDEYKTLDGRILHTRDEFLAYLKAEGLRQTKDGKLLTIDEYNSHIQNLFDDLSDEEKYYKWDPVEEAYRRGYHHGFIARCNSPDISEKEIREWRSHKKNICPPGSSLDGLSREMPLSELMEALNNNEINLNFRKPEEWENIDE